VFEPLRVVRSTFSRKQPPRPDQVNWMNRHLERLPAVIALTPVAAMAWVLTDARGSILEMSAAAERLFCVTKRSTRGRSIFLFFDIGRQDLMRDAMAAALGRAVTVSTRLRPKERRRVSVCLRIEPQSASTAVLANIIWTVEPGPATPRV
jgi:PAS domain-containing protein